MKNIALLGFGTVGSGVAELIEMNYEQLKANIGDDIRIKYILDLRDFKGHKLEDRFTKNFDDILNDSEVSVVAEMITGSHPAYEFTSALLRAGKSVVTSNKEVVANFGVELLKLAYENHVSYLFEASVGGGIPIIRPMMNSLAGDKIFKIDGILNGTSNYILTKMFECGLDFETALTSAQKLGYAEANPAADIDGMDVCRKICILSAIAYGIHVDTSKISTVGIRGISFADIEDAGRIGASVKLIAHSERLADDRAMICVEPRMVMAMNPLSTVKDVFNGIFLNTNGAGQLMFFGRGAGKLPTASAVTSDISEILMNDFGSIRHEHWKECGEDFIVDSSTEICDIYVRQSGSEMPENAELIMKREESVSFILRKCRTCDLPAILGDRKPASVLKILP